MTRPKRFQLAVVTALFASSAAAQSAADLGASVSTDVGGAVGSVSSGVTDAVSDITGGGSTGAGSGRNTPSGGAAEAEDAAALARREALEAQLTELKALLLPPKPVA